MDSPKKKPVDDMARTLYVEGTGMSGPELSDLVSKILKDGGYSPQDTETRKALGRAYQALLQENVA